MMSVGSLSVTTIAETKMNIKSNVIIVTVVPIPLFSCFVFDENVNGHLNMTVIGFWSSFLIFELFRKLDIYLHL